jgi:uncharacterized protein (DUF1800 family)
LSAARNADLDAAIALTRFSLGARVGEMAAARGDARAYLKAQIRPQGADQPVDINGRPLKSNAELYGSRDEYARMKRSRVLRNIAQWKQDRRDDYEAEFLARARLGASTKAGFRERWTLFWCNHFSLKRRGLMSTAIVGSFEREAVRPHVFGPFVNMLLASTHHATMLHYLDQQKSIGPNSEVGRRRGKGLNENLAREVMELHSLGVGAGYTQADVTEMARALTGWSINRDDGRFEFRPERHEPGTRRIMGKTYAQDGEAQASAALRNFAVHPHTAKHLARKIARHFVADEPPPSLVAKLATAYANSGGRLDRVAHALIDAPEAWEPAAKKFKAPYEFVISGWRAAGVLPARFNDIGNPLRQLGQDVYAPPSPKGWDDDAENWAGAAAIMKRIEWAGDFAGRFPAGARPLDTARAVLGPRLSPASATAITRAANREEAFALLLMLPEFQRR